MTELSLSSVGIASQFSAEFCINPRNGSLVFTGRGRGSELWAVEGVDAPGAMLSRSVAASSADIKIQKIAIKGEPAYKRALAKLAWGAYRRTEGIFRSPTGERLMVIAGCAFGIWKQARSLM